jgi:hypothetical protein
MKRLKYIYLAVIYLAVLQVDARNQASPSFGNGIDRQTFLSKHDLVWERLPQQFDHGAFIGNGPIFRDGQQQIRFEIGRSDVIDQRRNNGHLPIGGLLLTTVGQIQSGTFRTDLWNAEVRGEIITDKGTVKFRAIDHAFLSTEQPANKVLVEKSVKHWLTVENAKGINGWSLAAASSIYSYLGDGDNALHCLRAHHNSKVSVMPNTQYIEGSSVIEYSLVAAESLQEMPVQSYGDVIRIFSVVPAESEWKDATFQDLRVEGAFLVTAVRRDGKTGWVRIKSLAGEPCRVKPNFDGPFHVADASVSIREIKPGVFELGLKKEQEVVLYQDENSINPVAPVAIPQGKANFWGIK